MGRINYARVLLGGLVGGIVANACDFVINTFFMATDMQQMAQRLGLDAATVNSSTVAMSWVGANFIYLLLIAFTYAAIRPRFGPGPNTAILAGLVPFAAVTIILFGFTQMGVFPMPTYIKGTFFSAVTTILGSLTAGAMYRE